MLYEDLLNQRVHFVRVPLKLHQSNKARITGAKAIRHHISDTAVMCCQLFYVVYMKNSHEGVWVSDVY